MQYLRGFNELFEALDPSISHTPEEIKQMPEYQDLVTSFDLIDTTTGIIAKSGNIRFQEKGSPKSYTIHTTGAIRTQTLPDGSPGKLINEKGDSLIDILYGEKIFSKEDYIPKFEYLKRYFQKKKGIEPSPIDPEFVTKRLDILISKNPNVAKQPAVLKLIKKGIYKPDDYSKTVIDVSHFGLI